MIKRFLIILVLIFNLPNLSIADDISDFQIEGMSIGDNLLDFMNEDEINMNDLKFYPNDSKYYEIEYAEKSDIFDNVSIAIKRNDKKYKLRSYKYIRL